MTHYNALTLTHRPLRPAYYQVLRHSDRHFLIISKLNICQVKIPANQIAAGQTRPNTRLLAGDLGTDRLEIAASNCNTSLTSTLECPLERPSRAQTASQQSGRLSGGEEVTRTFSWSGRSSPGTGRLQVRNSCVGVSPCRWTCM